MLPNGARGPVVWWEGAGRNQCQGETQAGHNLPGLTGTPILSPAGLTDLAVVTVNKHQGETGYSKPVVLNPQIDPEETEEPWGDLATTQRHVSGRGGAKKGVTSRSVNCTRGGCESVTACVSHKHPREGDVVRQKKANPEIGFGEMETKVGGKQQLLEEERGRRSWIQTTTAAPALETRAGQWRG